MTDNNHPITPSPELVRDWLNEFHAPCPVPRLALGEAAHIAGVAARWGADQELEACCEWLVVDNWKEVSNNLRAGRRPKPPSLKEQALADLAGIPIWGSVSDPENRTLLSALDNIRRALESLPD